MSATFSIGFNFEDDLVDGIVKLNNSQPLNNRISEVYGSLPDSPVPSARPSKKLKNISFHKFQQQLERLILNNICFNYLLNTNTSLSESLSSKLLIYLAQLQELGITNITVGNIELCSFIKENFDSFKVCISSTFGVKTISQIKTCENYGADSVYLDSIHINRNFKRLREIITNTSLSIKLYANISCISRCPITKKHYDIFANKQNGTTLKQNDNYFASCSLIKLKSKVEWIQMQWIRPEDIDKYEDEGFTFFKLSDRLAPTNIILQIAQAYLNRKSPPNLFPLIERDGVKYKNIGFGLNGSHPIIIDSKKIPNNFIEHFKKGECISTDKKCSYCNYIAESAIHYNHDMKDVIIYKENMFSDFPKEMEIRFQ